MPGTTPPDKRLRMKRDGFTLLEVLLVVAALAILASIVISAINPGKQLADTRNAQRFSDVRAIMDSLYQYAVDHKGRFPADIDGTLRMIGTSTSGCSVTCGRGSGGEEGGAGTTTTESDIIVDADQTAFDAGNYHEALPGVSETAYTPAEGGVALTNYGLTNGSGRFTSSVKDAGGNATWGSVSWTPSRPVGKELPNDHAIESEYPNGNMNMTGNVLLLHMNELTDNTCGSSDVCDTSGNGAHGDRTGATFGAPGKFGAAIDFDGNDRVLFGNVLSPGASDWTFCTWIKPNATNGTYTLFNKEGLFGIRIENGYLRYLLAPDASWRGGNAFPVAVGQWYHVCLSYDHTNQYLYRNGAEIYRRGQTGNIGTNTSSVCMGAGRSNCNGDRLDGIMDELSIFFRTLSPTEIRNMYLRGALSMTLELRVCAEPDCGDKAAFDVSFTEFANTTLLPPSFASGLAEGRYLQYRATLSTTDTAETPVLTSFSLPYEATVAIPGGSEDDEESAEMTADACVDLWDELVFQYLNMIPEDPSVRSTERTYYAVKRTPGGRLLVRSCAVENGEVIEMTR